MTTYEIRVRGVISRDLVEQVAYHSHAKRETVLRAVLDDESGVYDMLEHLYGLGLELIDVRAVGTQAGTRTSPA